MLITTTIATTIKWQELPPRQGVEYAESLNFGLQKVIAWNQLISMHAQGHLMVAIKAADAREQRL